MLCKGCIIDRGIGYNPDPDDCSKYVQCYLQNGEYHTQIMPCPFGTFWDQSTITCIRSSLVNCPVGKFHFFVFVKQTSFFIIVIATSYSDDSQSLTLASFVMVFVSFRRRWPLRWSLKTKFDFIGIRHLWQMQAVSLIKLIGSECHKILLCTTMCLLSL